MGNKSRDEDNPEFLFSLTSGQLLSRILKKEIDCYEFASLQMANRGCDENGKWVGFANAKTFHLKRMEGNRSNKALEFRIRTKFSIRTEDLFKKLSVKNFKQFYKIRDNHFDVIEIELYRLIKKHLKDQHVKPTEVQFDSVYAKTTTRGVLTFEVTLLGTRTELKKVAGTDKVFVFDWDEF